MKHVGPGIRGARSNRWVILVLADCAAERDLSVNPDRQVRSIVDAHPLAGCVVPNSI